MCARDAVMTGWEFFVCGFFVKVQEVKLLNNVDGTI